MKYSLTYYLTLFVLKLKGIKKAFSQDPIDYAKIRKEDVLTPKGKFFKHHVLNTFKVLDSKVTEIGTNVDSNKLLLFIHGGAFISGPAQHHWDSIKSIAQTTEYKIWLCDYPKAPENKIPAITGNIDAVYSKALEEFNSSNICLMGDSVGGNLVITLVQRLIKSKTSLPKKLFLISPVMDASLSNPEIARVEKIDPMLSIKGIVSAKKMCAGKINLKNPILSPIYGSFEQFPPTVLFLAQNDIMYPDQQLLVKKLEDEHVDSEVIEGVDMPHIWPLLPIMKEAKKALNQMINILNANT
ncbi:MAG: alpha/beta hydrolase [Bacteroidota bacterium]